MSTIEMADEQRREIDREAQDREIERREELEALENELEHTLDDERFDTANEV